MTITPFEKKIWLASPTMHGEEQRWVDEAIQTNWVSTVGENINEVERLVAFVILEQIRQSPVSAVSCATRSELATMNGDETVERPDASARIDNRDAVVIQHRKEHFPDKVLFVQIMVGLRIQHGIRLYLHFLEVFKDNLSGIEIFVIVAIPGRIYEQANRAMNFPLYL